MDANVDKSDSKEGMGSETYFERNRYFAGKLMTSDDMAIEQQYHAKRLNTLNRGIAGRGLVYGLNAEVSATTDAQLEITLQPGLALDGRGRPVLVLEEMTIAENEPSDGTNEIYLYLNQAPQPWEKVPRPVSEDSTGNRCEYNRIVELPRLELTTEAKRTTTTETVPELDLSVNDRRSIAEQYYFHSINSESENETDGSAPEGFVLVGSFEKSSDRAWSEAEFKPGPLLHHNEMLYTILANHILDFDDPHRTGSPQSGNGRHIEDVLVSSDESIRIDILDSEIDLQVTEAIQDDLRSLHQYYRRKVLNLLRWTLMDVVTDFDSTRGGNSVAENVRKNITNGLDDSKIFLEEHEFLNFSEEHLLDGEMLTADAEEKYGLIQLEDDLEGKATEASLERYSAALRELREAIDVRGTPRYTQEGERELGVINALYNLNEAVKRLERRITEPADLPIDVIPGINRTLIDRFGKDDVRTVSELSLLKIGEITSIVDVSDELASLWLEIANDLVEE